MKNRAYKIAINPKYDGYQKESTVVAYKVFDKNIRSGASINEELDPELHKPVIKKMQKKDRLCQVERQHLDRRFIWNRIIVF